MKKEFKVKAISEKIELLEVNGQYITDKQRNCMTNCKKSVWSGNKSSKTKGCYQWLHHSAYKDPYK
ncbi:hypothetical protein C671_0340 [[Clostridium] bifermentans ATCC 19299]|uniref:Uncharacterized protein n=1 Tax=Paraclostridium bifermentans TaxID=1490 RepID=A0A5P3XGH2_PARBF|nr:hypothetical protein [Paraclostridium bifermentans]EQK48712.1 hypothetical protein C671_0340 [[Clostridium] bifermentans ATCC 19299] [Paraclostridium bifermentans ATCC 19299]MDV8113639.1 hypothetical protein [Bacillus sp. BAU-SS-2023]QEZ69460.1 hypothetical protein D4A35_11410 [Paraclostridium bifermentans]QEZ69586.1 hypothetical protein D4A35_12105 [Paraclostridium bifermentans]